MSTENKPYVGGLTISTDASFCPYTKAGGWAAYAVCNHFKIKVGGKLKGKMESAQEAEIKAIGNILHYILSSSFIPKFSYIYINTDCKQAIEAIENNPTPLESTVRENFQLLAIRTDCDKAVFKYVAAHTGARDSRSYVNEWCDKEAKRHMAIRRMEFNNIENARVKKIQKAQNAIKLKEKNKAKPCDVCPWTKKDQPDITPELRDLAKSGEWFCCHKNLTTCIGADNYKNK